MRFLHEPDGPILSVLVSVNNLKFNIVNIYTPNTISERKAVFEHLHDYFFSQGDLVIGGDFNCIDNPFDKFHSNDVNSTDKKSLCSLKSDFSLVDVWRKLHPQSVSFTRSNSSFSQASRLDRFFISKSRLGSALSSTILPCTLSDHEFITFVLRLDSVSNRENFIWKFNCSLLKDSDFKQLINNEIAIRKLEINNFPSLGAWWDDLKVRIRKISIDFSVRKRRNV